MDAIEPHWVSLLWFAGFATVGTVALLMVCGMFPQRSRPDAATHPHPSGGVAIEAHTYPTHDAGLIDMTAV